MIKATQIRAARALLGWRQTDLASAACMPEITVRDTESGEKDSRRSTIAKIQSALETAGVEFIEGGVRLKALPPED